MKEVDEKRGTLPSNPCAAAMDIDRRNKENKALWTGAQIAKAHKLRELAIEAHKDGGKVYPPNFRKTEINVKVAGARTRDKSSAGWPALDAYCTKHGIVRKVTPNGSWIYSFK